jgi:hypothetical protein
MQPSALLHHILWEKKVLYYNIFQNSIISNIVKKSITQVYFPMNNSLKKADNKCVILNFILLIGGHL